VQIYAFHS